MRTRLRAWTARVVPILGAMTVVMAGTGWPINGLTEAAAAPSAISLVGFGGFDISAEQGSWIQAISSDTGGTVNLSVSTDGIGDQTAANQLALGLGDFAITGLPLQPGQLKQGEIAAPIMPSGLEFLFDPPVGGWQVSRGSQIISYGPQTQTGNVVPWVPGQSTIQGCQQSPSDTYTDTSNGCPALNVPADALAALYLAPSTSSNGPDGEWESSAILNTWPGLNYTPGDSMLVNRLGLTNGSKPTHYFINTPNVDNYYFQEWFTTLENLTTEQGGPPSASEAVQPANWSVPLSSSFTQNPTEALPPGAFTAGSITDMSGLIGLPPETSATNPQSVDSWASPPPPNFQPGGVGAIALTPPSGQFLVDQEEDTRLASNQSSGQPNPSWWPIPEEISVPNADGEFVAPTPAAIEQGVNAGAQANESACSNTNTNAMYAATHATTTTGEHLSGAYPITWVDCMWVPATGLSVAKTDAVAGLIRYLVTDGQSVLHPSGDGELPEVYVQQALTAANQVVTDNCPAAGGKVAVTATPTGYTPISPGVQGLGAVDECEAVSTPPSTPPTTAPGESSSTTGSPTTAAIGPSTTAGSGSSGLGSLGEGSLTGFGTGALSGFGLGSGLGLGSSSSRSSTLAEALAASEPQGTLAAKTSPTGSGKGASGQSGSGSKHEPVGLAASIAANLPDPLTGAGQSIDKLSALLLGGLLFLGGRSAVRRFLKARRG